MPSPSRATIEAPVLVCIGNPPYHRQTLARGEQTPRKGGWVRFGAPRPILRDFVDPGAGVHTKSLYNDYVYFWRWAVWLVCEQRTGPGIVSLITPTSFLHGPGFGAMRAWLRRQLRRPVGARPGRRWARDPPLGQRFRGRPDAGGDLHGRTLRRRRFRDGCTTRASAAHASTSLANWHACVRSTTSPGSASAAQGTFIARARSGYLSWPKLTDLFPRQLSGCQMKRRWPIAPSIETLRQRWHGPARAAARRARRGVSADARSVDRFRAVWPRAAARPARGRTPVPRLRATPIAPSTASGCSPTRAWAISCDPACGAWQGRARSF